MKIITVSDQIEGGREAFALLKKKLSQGAKTLGLATGSSPLTFYQQVVQSDLEFTELTSINLDEYLGLVPEHPQSYHTFMQEHLFQYKPFKESFLPNGLAQDLEAEAQRYETIIAAYPIDFQILGIGRNGHIGFNEPGTAFDSQTHVVNLTKDTIRANSRFFDRIEDVPTQAISMGIGSIMKAKTIVLVAYGAEKAEAIAKTVKGSVTAAVPASILQTHADVVLIIDKAAASKL
ncbi:glucosamine-6-phosphate deaminase [Streptococcus dentiloxodontae]